MNGSLFHLSKTISWNSITTPATSLCNYLFTCQNLAQNVRHMFVDLKWIKHCSEKNWSFLLKAVEIPNYIFMENAVGTNIMVMVAGRVERGGEKKNRESHNWCTVHRENSKTMCGQRRTFTGRTKKSSRVTTGRCDVVTIYPQSEDRVDFALWTYSVDSRFLHKYLRELVNSYLVRKEIGGGWTGKHSSLLKNFHLSCKTTVPIKPNICSRRIEL